GFIGRNLVHALRETDYKLFTLEETFKPGSGKRIDISTQALEPIFSSIKPDVVIHLAAKMDVRESFADPIRDLEVNGLGTLKVLRASQLSGCQNFVYVASGGAIYDSNSPMPLTENSPESRPVSPYGLSKRLGEDYVRLLCEKAQTSWTSIVLSNCYGQVEDHQRGVIFEFWKAIAEGQRPKIYGSEITRDFVYISDVVNALMKTIDSPTNTRVNVSSQSEISLLDLFNKIAKIMKSEIEPILFDAHIGDVLRNCLSNTKAKELLGWEPSVNLDQGLKLSLPIPKSEKK
ncbi:MAG: NAD-dependent epimerase/dehydratase family protein, partial [Actinobacteria bacterium]|nr:NAD-dependent epimerase/dehydratase family protein [Actinomycetota bacterium]